MGYSIDESIKPPIRKLGKQVKILLIVVFTAVAFRSLGMSIVDIGLPSFILSLAGTLSSFGIVIGIFSVMQSIFQFPFAAASDRYGRRKIVLIGLIIYITGTFLCFFAQNILQLIIFRAIQGAGAYTSILQAVIGDIFRKDEHGRGMGYYSLSMNLGYFGGIVIGGYISSYLGFRSIFSISGMLICITAFLLYFMLKEKKENQNSANSNYKVNNNDISFNLKNIKILLKEFQYVTSVSFNSVRWFIFGGIVAYLIWVLQVHFNLNEIESSYVLLFIVALYVCFVFISSRILDRYGPRKIILIGVSIVIIFGISFFFMNLIDNLIIFLVVTSFIGIGIALIDPAGNALLLNVIEDINPDLKGSGIGFNNAFGFFISALAPIVICSLGEIYVFFPFYIIMILMIFSLIIVYKFTEK
ncbi:MAG: MFS transporter [Candidatus Thorarchaeota archaeon]